VIKKIRIGLHVKCPLFLSDFDGTWPFLTAIRKNSNKSNLMKIHPVGAELFHVDGRTDGQLIVTFRNFGNALKN
jgi:hypothetical protein